MASAFSEY
ncbi:hypothetical protein SAMN04487761_14319 [Lachnospiraceae bacterium C7]|nr:hypothetical protein SAMN04487761_14319 [Lachnospiraceae bacterium C7]